MRILLVDLPAVHRFEVLDHGFRVCEYFRMIVRDVTTEYIGMDNFGDHYFIYYINEDRDYVRLKEDFIPLITYPKHKQRI